MVILWRELEGCNPLTSLCRSSWLRTDSGRPASWSMMHAACSLHPKPSLAAISASMIPGRLGQAYWLSGFSNILHWLYSQRCWLNILYSHGCVQPWMTAWGWSIFNWREQCQIFANRTAAPQVSWCQQLTSYLTPRMPEQTYHRTSGSSFAIPPDSHNGTSILHSKLEFQVPRWSPEHSFKFHSLGHNMFRFHWKNQWLQFVFYSTKLQKSIISCAFWSANRPKSFGAEIMSSVSVFSIKLGHPWLSICLSDSTLN